MLTLSARCTSTVKFDVQYTRMLRVLSAQNVRGEGDGGRGGEGWIQFGYFSFTVLIINSSAVLPAFVQYLTIVCLNYSLPKISLSVAIGDADLRISNLTHTHL